MRSRWTAPWAWPGPRHPSAAGAGGSAARSRGAHKFACARAYRLAYAVTRMPEHDRLWHRMAKIARRLGDRDSVPGIPPPRPKGMRTATYDRLLAAWHDADEHRDEIFDAKIAGCITRLKRLGR